MKVKIVDLDHKGNGIGKIDNKIIFIPKSIPGDIVDIDIVKHHKNYDDGRINKIINSSEDRIDSLCPYYSTTVTGASHSVGESSISNVPTEQPYFPSCITITSSPLRSRMYKGCGSRI